MVISNLILSSAALAGGVAGTVADAPVLADDEFVAACVDLTADEISAASLCVVGLDGTVDRLADGLVAGGQIAVSPDRTAVATITEDAVIVVDAAGEQLASIPAADVTGVAWMPGGDALLVQQATDDEWSVTLHGLDKDAEPREVVAGDPVDADVERGISVTPDGTQLVYAWRHDDASRLTAVDIDSGTNEDILESEEFISVPDVSPDGEQVAVVVGERIEVVDVDSGKLVHTVTRDGAVTTPSFSPDGTQLMYVESRGAVEYQDIGDEGSERVVYDITREDDPAEFPAVPTWS